MLSHIVGPGNFLSGIKSYLKKHQFESVGRDDLWAAMDKVAEAKRLPGMILLFQSHLISSTYYFKHCNCSFPEGQTIKDVMETWVTQSRFPLLTVRREANGTSVTFSQEEFPMQSGEQTASKQFYDEITACSGMSHISV